MMGLAEMNHALCISAGAAKYSGWNASVSGDAHVPAPYGITTFGAPALASSTHPVPLWPYGVNSASGSGEALPGLLGCSRHCRAGKVWRRPLDARAGGGGKEIVTGPDALAEWAAQTGRGAAATANANATAVAASTTAAVAAERGS